MPPAELHLDHLSVSSTNSYIDCGRAWKAKYQDGVTFPASPAQVIGSVFDRCVERYLRAQCEGSPKPVATFWGGAWRELTAGSEARPIDWQGEMPEAVHNQGERLVTSPTVQHALAGIRPLQLATGPALQMRVELRVPGVPIQIIGFIDVITDDGAPGDIKTAARAWSADKVRKDLQPRIYLAALVQAGFPVKRGPNGGYLFRHWVFTKTRTVQVHLLETEYSAMELLIGMAAIRAAYTGMAAGAFAPNSHSWDCGVGCPVWTQCLGKR